MKLMLMKSLIGLAILVIITLENIILCRKKTIPVTFLDQIFFSLLVFKFFGWITLVYSGLLIALVIFVKYRNHVNETADFDFTDRILSVSAVFNVLHRPKDLVIGSILPVNNSEIKYNMKKIELDDTILSGGMLITGSTGSGKTTTMKTILKQRIDEGRPVVFFDYKGEEDILEEIESFTKSAGLPFYEFSSRKCNFTYDPFVNLNETGKVEALMNTRRWATDGADEHYKTSMQLAIQNLVRGYDEFRKENEETCNYVVGLYKYAESNKYIPKSDEKDGFANLKKSLKILMTSKATEMLQDDPSFTFETDKPYVICFSFTSANKALANYLSSFVYTDLMDRGTRHHYENKLLLCIDEFGTLESSTLIKDLLEKGRSGGVQTVFSILDVNQIAMNAGEFFVQAILGTINSFIIHAGATQSTATLLAGVQKYEKDYDIMSLRKPYNGKKPTALFITKYGLLHKKNNQDVYRMLPYTSVLKKIKQVEQDNSEEETEQDNMNYDNIVDIKFPKDPEELDLTQPLDLTDVDQYL